MMRPLHLLPFLPGLSYATTEVLLPLYLYPLPGAWSPIKSAVAAHPDLTFNIVINPNNGPTNAPDGNYDPETSALGAYPNVKLLGYVHTSTDWGATRCNIPFGDITHDIEVWYNWTINYNIPISGIFVDEAPVNTANGCVNYMQNVTWHIKNTFGPGAKVVYNPGYTGGSTAIQTFYDLSPGPDLVVAAETCFVTSADAWGSLDECPTGGTYTTYDSAGVGSYIDTYVTPYVGSTRLPKTAVLVHGFHDDNGGTPNIVASSTTLSVLLEAVVNKSIGATFFNTAGYQAFHYTPVDIGTFANALDALV